MTLKKQIVLSVVAGVFLTFLSVQVVRPPVPCGQPGSPQPGRGDMPCLGAQTAGWPLQIIVLPPTPFYNSMNAGPFLSDAIFWSIISFALIRIGSMVAKRHV
jgi:hypothetical protein